MLKSLSYYFIALVLVACSGATGDANRLHGPQNPQQTCLPLPSEIEINGVPYKIGNPIGSGSYGVVYGLETFEGNMSKDYVVKLIKTTSQQEAKNEALTEVQLAQLLNQSSEKLATDTTLDRIIRFLYRGRNFHTPLLIKDRVIGHTAYDLMRSPLLVRDMGTTYKKAYESFVKFEEALITNLAKLSDEDKFIVDLHRKNIMFDGEKWFVVDGFVLSKKQDLVDYLKGSYDQILETDVKLKVTFNTVKNSDDETRKALPFEVKKRLFRNMFDTENQQLKSSLEEAASKKHVSI
jgi:serine/threonine protein kinase